MADDRYTVEEKAAQVAAVETLRRDEGLSYRKIAERLDLPLATVHRRAALVVQLDEGRDTQRATELRHEATMEIRSWLGRIDEATRAPADDPLADRIPLVQAFPLVLKGWEFLARMGGAYLPVRVKVEDDRRPPDPVLAAIMEEEARKAGLLDDEEVRRVLAEDNPHDRPPIGPSPYPAHPR